MRLDPHHLRRMCEQLELHEGVELKEYLDTATPPRRTIGCGYNVTDRGTAVFEKVLGRKYDGTITREESRRLLEHDVEKFARILEIGIPWVVELDPIRYRVLLDMCFNMGLTTLKTFTSTLPAFRAKDWPRAKRLMLKTKWAQDVGDGEGKRWDRAERLAEMTLTGEDYTK